MFDGDIGKGSNEYIELYTTTNYDEAQKAVNGVIRPYMKKRN